MNFTSLMLGEMYFVQMKSNIWSKYVRVAVCVNNVSSGQLSHEMLLSYSIAQSSGEGDWWIMNNLLSLRKNLFFARELKRYQWQDGKTTYLWQMHGVRPKIVLNVLKTSASSSFSRCNHHQSLPKHLVKVLVRDAPKHQSCRFLNIVQKGGGGRSNPC